MNCDQLAILQITDGTTVVDLLDRDSGFLLKEWTPQIADFKDGGIFQNSPLATGRRLVAYRFDNVTETMSVSTRHVTADALIQDTQTLRRLLQKAADYWATDWQNVPVYVIARGKGETNTRYCVIQQGRLGIDGNPYGQPFMQPASSPYASVFDEQPLIFERGHWLSEEPGQAVDVPLSSTQVWSTPDNWEVETTTPVGDVTAMLEMANGTLLAGTNSNASLYQSTDGGSTWTLNTSFAVASAIRDVKEYTLAGVTSLLVGVSGTTNGIAYSNDGGATWTGPDFNTTYVVYQGTFVEWIRRGGVVDSSGNGELSSTFIAVNQWQARNSATIGTIVGMVEADPTTGTLAYIADDHIYTVTYEVPSMPGTVRVTHGSSTFAAIFVTESGRILAGMGNGVVYYSDNQAVNFSTATTTLTGGAFAFAQDANGVLYAGGNGLVWVSYNDGDIWYESNADAVGAVASLLVKSDGVIYAGEDGQILKLDPNTYTATSTHVVNGHPLAEITNVMLFDNSLASYIDNFPGGTLPYDIYSGDNADILYIGVNEGAGEYTFTNVVFNITTATRTYGGNGTWQYWNGAWTTLNVQNNSIGNSGAFSETGQWAVSWVAPSDWAVTTVNGIQGRWVRLTNLIAFTSSLPEQGEYPAYAMRNAYVEVAADAVIGDLPALARIEIDVASDRDGPSGSAPDGYINRAIVALRSVERGERFNAYLNASDQGNDPGVAVSIGTDTTFVTDVTYPSNRRATYSPASTGNWLDIVTWTLAADLVDDYYGTFHVFLRARQVGGTAEDVQVRLKTSTGSGGIEITTPSQVFVNLLDYQFLDFGRVTIPVSSLQNAGEEGDEATFVIQCNAASTSPDVYFMDLVLIPIDEWYGDFTDQQRDATSPLTGGYYLDVDSATYPKRTVRAQVRASNNDRIKNVFRPATNGEAILQANMQQRLWFFFARTAGAGSPDVWYSQPSMAAKITLEVQQRYLGMRGAR